MQKTTEPHTFSSFTPQARVDIAIEIARLYYLKNTNKNHIAKKLNLTDARTVNKLLEYAREVGIISITVHSEASAYVAPQRDTRLEEELIATYAQLDHVVVVKLPPSEDNHELDDGTVHEMLGRALAEELRPIIRSGDHIGVAGGRATAACANAMKIMSQKVPFPQSNIMITPLAGGISRNSVTPPVKLLSSDNIATTMATAFRDASRRLLHVPWVALSGQTTVCKYPSERLILPKAWDEDKTLIPTIAIVGIGVIKEGLHPFSDERKLELEPIRTALYSLKAEIKNVGYDAVGDLGQRLFQVSPLENVQVDPNALRKLAASISEINEHILAPTFPQLRKVNLVIAIAGGKFKRQAIWTVLSHPELVQIRGLCTDSVTAKWLIERGREVRC